MKHGHIFFNDTATTEIYTLSLHDALPISGRCNSFCGMPSPRPCRSTFSCRKGGCRFPRCAPSWTWRRSEEHTSELQSRQYLVCRLLLEKKKNRIDVLTPPIPTLIFVPCLR